MKVLQTVVPTAEQLRVIQDAKPGVTLIRGAAGSGKTTTALIRLSFLAEFWRSRRRRVGSADQVRILVLTYNKTLRGYIRELADQQVKEGSDLNLTVSTFGRWARSLLRDDPLVNAQSRTSKLRALGAALPLEPAFVSDEADYAVGRFRPENIDEYLTCRREQRGRAPRVDRSMREALLAEVVQPYELWKRSRGEVDWNDLAVALSRARLDRSYDVVVVDEAQDFSANEIRALMNHVATDHTVTFILDAAQRIYPRHFQWSEVGISIQPNHVFRLGNNYRNTKEIAAFAKALIDGLELTDDGTMPDFESCIDHGPRPRVVIGTFGQQMSYLIDFIDRYVNLQTESVAFLHPLGGGWFDYTRERLSAAGVGFVDMTGKADWPAGPTNVGLSTLHSAKGLEFDHVFIVGLNKETTPVGPGAEDAQLDNLRRLLAMAAGRAKTTVIVSYKPTDVSDVVRFLDASTYDLMTL